MADIDITHGSAFPATAASADRIAAFLRAAYGWMCAGLAITAATAWFVASSPSLLRMIAQNQLLYFGLFIAQLGIVFVPVVTGAAPLGSRRPRCCSSATRCSPA